MLSYFYYWYEPPSADPFTVRRQSELGFHFPAERPGDWRSASWFRQQFLDMQEAGIDVALAVYWGDNPSRESAWSTGGLAALVEALDGLSAEGRSYPKVGLFFDTYVLQGANLTDPKKISWLASQLQAFFQRVPARHRATQDGRPIIWLYYSDHANDFNQATFERLNATLLPTLGQRPFWVAEKSWAHPTWTDGLGRRHDAPSQSMPFDAYYQWSAAGRGMLFMPQPLPIAAVGPGYDDTRLPDRGVSRWSRSRESGCFYARNWRAAQTVGARWVVVETWNELYEASAIAETVEHGRAYIEATARYSRAFKSGEPVTLPKACGDPDPLLAGRGERESPFAPLRAGSASEREIPTLPRSS